MPLSSKPSSALDARPFGRLGTSVIVEPLAPIETTLRPVADGVPTAKPLPSVTTILLVAGTGVAPVWKERLSEVVAPAVGGIGNAPRLWNGSSVGATWNEAEPLSSSVAP